MKAGDAALASWGPLMTQPRLHKYPGHRLTTRQQSAQRRASFRSKVYGPMARLPIGIIPQICVAVATTREMMIQRMKRRASRATAVCVFLGVLTPIAFADQLAETYLKPKVEAVSAAQLSPANSSVTPYYGTEVFDGRPTGASTGFTTNFSTGGTTSANLGTGITGTFGGSFTIAPHDLYGGAGGIGNYITTVAGTGIDLKLAHTNALPGINYVGLQISALDAGNTITFYRAGLQLGQYGPANLIQQVGACPNSSNPYCGNPTTGQDAGEQFAYVNFFDLSGYFDEIRFTETISGAGFESDNYTVGYVDTNAVFQATNVPEPSSITPLLSALATLLGLTAWQRRRRRTMSPAG